MRRQQNDKDADTARILADTIIINKLHSRRSAAPLISATSPNITKKYGEFKDVYANALNPPIRPKSKENDKKSKNKQGDKRSATAPKQRKRGALMKTPLTSKRLMSVGPNIAVPLPLAENPHHIQRTFTIPTEDNPEDLVERLRLIEIMARKASNGVLDEANEELDIANIQLQQIKKLIADKMQKQEEEERIQEETEIKKSDNLKVPRWEALYQQSQKRKHNKQRVLETLNALNKKLENMQNKFFNTPRTTYKSIKDIPTAPRPPKVLPKNLEVLYDNDHHIFTSDSNINTTASFQKFLEEYDSSNKRNTSPNKYHTQASINKIISPENGDNSYDTIISDYEVRTVEKGWPGLFEPEVMQNAIARRPLTTNVQKFKRKQKSSSDNYMRKLLTGKTINFDLETIPDADELYQECISREEEKSSVELVQLPINTSSDSVNQIPLFENLSTISEASSSGSEYKVNFEERRAQLRKKREEEKRKEQKIDENDTREVSIQEDGTNIFTNTVLQNSIMKSNYLTKTFACDDSGNIRTKIDSAARRERERVLAKLVSDLRQNHPTEKRCGAIRSKKILAALDCALQNSFYTTKPTA